MHDSVYDVAGDPRMAKAIRLILTKLADGPDGPLKEMSEGVLSGHVDLRAVTSTPFYDDALGTAVAPVLRQYEEMDEGTRRELVRRTEAELDDLLNSA